MNDLLAASVAAHGGLQRWSQVERRKALLSIDGALWPQKQQPGLLKAVSIEAQTKIERLVLQDFTGPGRRLQFAPDRLVLTEPDGTTIANRDNPRSTSLEVPPEAPWDVLHAAYFACCALWTYLMSPFLYTYPGFVTEEIDPWRENGETWRRLKITFPDNVASHTREQVSHFGPDGLLRRHDYDVDVLGGATGANYASGYRDFDGIKIATRRRVYGRAGNGQKIPDPVLVSIDIENVSLS